MDKLSVVQQVLWHMGLGDDSGPAPFSSQQVSLLLDRRLERGFGSLTSVASLAEPGQVNHVYLVKCAKQEGGEQELVLKLTNSDWRGSKTLNEVFALGAARRALPTLVPAVLAYESDASRSEISAEFILMAKLPGQRLANLWTSLQPNEQSNLITGISTALQTLRGLYQFDLVGNFASEGSDRPTIGPLIAFDWKHPNAGIARVGPLRSYCDLFTTLVERHLTQISTAADPAVVYIIPYVRQYLGKIRPEIAQETAQSFVFSHGDFNAGNLLIASETNPDGTKGWKLSAIVDWEWAGSYPAEYELMTGFGWLHRRSDLKEAISRQLQIHEPGLDRKVKERQDYYVVEKCLARLENYKAHYPDERKASLARDFALQNLASLLAKHSVTLPIIK